MERIFIGMLIGLLLISCNGNSCKDMSDQYEESYETGVNIFDTLAYDAYYKKMQNGETISVGEGAMLHVKYENNTLWLYYNLNEVKRFDNVVYTDLDEIMYDNNSKLLIGNMTERIFYYKDTHKIILTMLKNIKITAKVEDNMKELMESKDAYYCVPGYVCRSSTIDEAIEFVEQQKRDYYANH